MAGDTISVRLWLDGGRRFSQQAKQAARSTRDLGRELRETGREARAASGGLGLVGRVMGLIRPAAMITGLGLAAGGLSAVAAGGVAVGSALGPLVGVAAAAGAGMVALKTSMSLVRVAGMGVQTSMKGVFDDFSRATPATDSLARTVKGFVPQLLSLKNSVQGRILGGLEDGLRSAAPLIGKLSPAIKQTASVLGGLAREAGKTAGGLGGPLSRILSTNAGLIRNVGRAGINMAVVFVRLLDAARPLTAWLGRLALGWSESTLAATNAGAKSGKLTAFFEKTRRVLSRVFDVTGNVARGLFNIGRAAAPMGNLLLGSLDKTTAGFARFTGSVAGQARLREFFADARPVIMQVAGLIGDVAGSFLRLAVSANGGLAPLVAKIREIVPILERVVMSTTAAFGPVLVGFIAAAATAFEPLMGSSGPLVVLVQGLTALANAATFVAQNVPGGSAAITTLFGALAVSSALGIGAFASQLTGVSRGVGILKSGVGFLTRALIGNAAAQNVAAAATTRAKVAMFAQGIAARASAVATGVATLATRAFAGAQRILNFVMRANPLVRVAMLLFALGGAFVVAYKKSETFRNIVNGVWSAVKGAVTSAVSWIGRQWGNFKRGVQVLASSVRDKFNGLVGFFRSLPGRISGAARGMWDGIKNGFRSAINFLIRGWNNLQLTLNIPDKVPGLPDKLTLNTPNMPLLATGGVVQQPGWAVVGERGPELLRLPGASTVFDAGQTAAVLPAAAMTPSVAMALPAPAAMRTPRVRGNSGSSGGERIDVHVDVGPTTLRLQDREIGESTGRAVTTHTARRR